MAFTDLLKKLSPIDFEEKPKKEAKAKGKTKVQEEAWTNSIKFRTVVEILGAPKEHIEKTLKQYVDKIKKDKNYKVHKVNIEKATERGKLFATFADLDLAAKDVNAVAGFCFDYMPSSIEVYEPYELTFKSKEMSDFFNDLQADLHKLDMMVKELKAKNTLLEKNAKQIVKNSILVSLKERSKDIGTISKGVGLPEQYTEMLLKELASEQWITKEGESWKLIRSFS